MAKSTGTKSFTPVLVLSSVLLLVSCFCVIESQSSPPIVAGLSWTFYNSSCPKVESIIRHHLEKKFEKDIGLAAGLLRLQFHDCFVQGCDGSLLLDGTASDPSEQEATPNLTLIRAAFETINDLRGLVDKVCGRVVSCADIVIMAARDAVYLTGGPEYNVPLGRRDSLTYATEQVVIDNLPSPFSNASIILESFATKNLNATDVVALSGGHTIGVAHCPAFTNRLYPIQDPDMNKTFANDLKKACPTLDTNNTVVNDIRTPNKFDNMYYVDLVNREGLFTSDQDLYTDNTTKGIVTSFAVDQDLFFDKFVYAIIEMGQLNVLTGNEGEIRANCSKTNSNNESLVSLVKGAAEALSDFI